MISRRAFVLSIPIIGLASAPALSDARKSSAIVTAQALATVNDFRADNNQAPLVIDPRAERAALRHCEEMALLGKLTNDNLNERLAEVGIEASSVENLGVGQNNVAQVISDWKKSRDYRRNLLGAYNRFGMAVARNASSDNMPYWAMVLSV